MTDLLEIQLGEYLDPGRTKWSIPKFAPELERQFDEEGRDLRRKSDWMVGLAGIVIFDLFLYTDHQLNPAVFYARAIFFRLFVFTPFALLATVAAVHWPSRMVHDRAWSFTVTLAGLCTLLVCRNLNTSSSLLCTAGMMIVLTCGTLVNRASFLYALGFNVLLVAAQVVIELSDPCLNYKEKNAAVLLLASSCALSLMTNYKMERADRMTYVLLLRERMRGRKLTLRNQALSELSQLDALTGLANRRHFDWFLREAWAEAHRDGTPLSLMMIDIDHFKRLNDTHGHLAGDQVLTALGKFLAETVRADTDLPARYGGEEFAVILPHTSLDQAADIAEELRHRICDATLQLAACTTPLAITMSCGVASRIPNMESDGTELIALADRALYSAKRSGRNRVCADAEQPLANPVLKTMGCA